jgi:hypothetical protein
MNEKTEQTKLNIYQKLQQSRVDLQKKELKKTGFNKYSNYGYFELGDFLPSINEICNKNGLASIFKFESTLATLTIIDVDNIENTIEFSTPIEIALLKGCSTIQNIGGTQSYARRYLYIMAFEIAESDTVENQVDKDAEVGKQKINQATIFTIKSLISETGSNETKFLDWAGVKKVEDITNAAMGTCLNKLNKIKETLEKEKKEAKKNKEMPIDLNL